MLVPAMQSTGTRSSSSTCSTPRCAPPRAPPPPSTRPTRGRPAAWTASAAATRKASATLDAQRERREPRVAVIVVLVLGALERPHDGVGDRREDRLHAD